MGTPALPQGRRRHRGANIHSPTTVTCHSNFIVISAAKRGSINGESWIAGYPIAAARIRPQWVKTVSSVRNVERPLARSRFGLICAVGLRQMSAVRNLSVSFLDVATSGSGLLRAPRKEDR
jgi:hypothetical protein